MTSKSGSDDSGNELLMDSDGDIWTERYQRWIAPEDLSIIISLELRLANHQAALKELAIEMLPCIRNYAWLLEKQGICITQEFEAFGAKLRSLANGESDRKT